MSLPVLPLPQIPLPVTVPEMVHPLIVHFVVVLPVVIVFIELLNLVLKKRTLSVLSFVFIVLTAILAFAALLSGGADAKLAQDSLTGDAKALLTEHKTIGSYILYGTAVLLLFKLLAMIFKKTALKVVYFLFLFIFIAMVFSEGKKGGELVYKYGVNTMNKKAAHEVRKVNNEKHAEEKKSVEKAIKKHEEAKKESVESEKKTEHKTESNLSSEHSKKPEAAKKEENATAASH